MAMGLRKGKSRGRSTATTLLTMTGLYLQGQGYGGSWLAWQLRWCYCGDVAVLKCRLESRGPGWMIFANSIIFGVEYFKSNYSISKFWIILDI